MEPTDRPTDLHEVDARVALDAHRALRDGGRGVPVVVHCPFRRRDSSSGRLIASAHSTSVRVPRAEDLVSVNKFVERIGTAQAARELERLTMVSEEHVAHHWIRASLLAKRLMMRVKGDRSPGRSTRDSQSGELEREFAEARALLIDFSVVPNCSAADVKEELEKGKEGAGMARERLREDLRAAEDRAVELQSEVFLYDRKANTLAMEATGNGVKWQLQLI